jgi:Cu/Ag efflux pump CusA
MRRRTSDRARPKQQGEGIEMGIVRFALKFPYTFYVLAALIVFLDASFTRIRPVLMTAAAMVVGMTPMAIGGAGEEQNAALARAVIGGLLFATPTTLLIVPYLFATLRKRNDGVPAHGVFEDRSDE